MKNIYLLVLAVLTTTCCFPQSGILDPTFGNRGIVRSNLDSNYNYTLQGRKVLTLADGSFYLVFYANGNTLIEKKLPNGITDSSYGINGYSLPLSVNFFAAALAPDGKVVITGNTNYNGPRGDGLFATGRFTANGFPDSTYNGNGIVSEYLVPSTQYGQNEENGNSVIVQPDGKIIAAGETDPFNGIWSLVRYNVDGTRDTSFGTDGVSNVPNHIFVNAIALRKDGKIISAGSVIDLFTIRGDQDYFTYTDSGHTNAPFTAVAVLPNNRIVATSGDGNNFTVQRFTNLGKDDSTFNGTGIQVTDFGGTDAPNSIVIQPDQKIVVAGSTTTGATQNFALARYTTSGSVDSSFNDSGKIVTPFDTSASYAASVAIDSVGKVIAFGTATSLSGITYLAAARYNTDGSTDNSLSTSGKIMEALKQGNTVFYATAVQADGKPVSAGYAWNGTNNDFALERFNLDGTPDNTFNGTGKVFLDFASGDDRATSVVIQTDGKIVVGGSSNGILTIVRYNTNGTIDATFNGIGTKITGISSGGTAKLALETGGRIIAGSGSTISAYTNAGNVDATFGSSGVVNISTDAVIDLDISNDNIYIITVGYSVQKYNSTGTLDSSFYQKGLPEFDPEYEMITPKALKVGPDGKIAVVSNYEHTYRVIISSVYLTRLNSDGGEDGTFDGSANATVETQSMTFVNAVTVQSNNKIIIGGFNFDGSHNNFALARFNTNGSFDSSFNGGLFTTPTSTLNNELQSLTITPDKLYATGFGLFPGSLGVVVRYDVDDAVLPVTLINLSAHLQNNVVLLQWKTAQEHNLSYFNVEKSMDGNNFSQIGKVTASDNSNIALNYSLIDKNPLKGINFYRLRLTDADGKYTYSKTAAVNYNGKSITISIFPNPVIKTLYIQANNGDAAAVLRIEDAAGKALKNIKTTLYAGEQLPVDLSNLPAGTYIIQAITLSGNISKQFIKK